MRALVQRVTEADVAVGDDVTGSIGPGLVILLGVSAADTTDDARRLAAKCAALRIFDDAEGRMNLSVKQTGGEALVVSQFTLYADASRGNRPSYAAAAPADVAGRLYGEFLASLREEIGPGRVQAGVFRAMMKVRLINDGPVTIMVDTESR
jgi:D-aminoacyl-tRNA deacylase